MIEIGAIIPPEFAPGTTFEITSAMIHFLNLKGLFAALLTDDANRHTVIFVGILNFYNLHGVSQEVIRMRLFCFSLMGVATL